MDVNTEVIMVDYSMIPPSQYEAVMDHLRLNFQDEPLNSCVKYFGTSQCCPLSEWLYLKTMKTELSVMATDKNNGKIVGVALNGIEEKHTVEDILKYIDEENAKLMPVVVLMEETNFEANLYSKYNVDIIFDLKVLSVDASYRNRGIGIGLVAKSEEVARKNGFKVMKADATSIFTQKIAKRQGFLVEKSVDYRNYKDKEGRKVFDIEAPHFEYQLVVKPLDP